MNEDIIAFSVQVIVAIIFFIVTFVRTGSIKKSIKKLQGVDMKFKTTSGVIEKESKDPLKQSFTEFEDSYVLDPSSNEIVKLPDQKNVQVVIQSYHSSALDKLLERFVTSEVEEGSQQDLVDRYERATLDLASMADALSAAEEYKEQLGLDPSTSLDDVYKAMEQHSDLLKQRISEFNKQEVKNDASSSSADKKEDK